MITLRRTSKVLFLALLACFAFASLTEASKSKSGSKQLTCEPELDACAKHGSSSKPGHQRVPVCDVKLKKVCSCQAVATPAPTNEPTAAPTPPPFRRLLGKKDKGSKSSSGSKASSPSASASKPSSISKSKSASGSKCPPGQERVCEYVFQKEKVRCVKENKLAKHLLKNPEDHTGTALGVCDRDECVDGSNNCSPDATCTNVPGCGWQPKSFTCKCNCGFEGDGVTCTKCAPPTLTHPSEKTVEIPCEQADLPAVPVVTASGQCGQTLPVHLETTLVADPSADGERARYVWSTTDCLGRTTTATLIIKNKDTIAPTLVGVPAAITAECDAVPVPASVSATDNCAPGITATFTESRADGASDNDYVLTRTWTAIDTVGLVTSASQTVTVADTTRPELVGVPADAAVDCDSIPTPAAVSATDNCATSLDVSLDETRTDGNCASNYILKRTWSVSDPSGNTISATQTITVSDNKNPTITNPPAAATIACAAFPPVAADIGAADTCSADANLVTSFDDALIAPPPTPTATPIPFRRRLLAIDEGSLDRCGGYQVARTYTVTDECGLIAEHTQEITVSADTTKPTLTVPADQQGISCEAVLALASVTISTDDDCSGVVSTSSSETVTDNQPSLGLRTYTRTWTATDACGNQDSATQTIQCQIPNPCLVQNSLCGADATCFLDYNVANTYHFCRCNDGFRGDGQTCTAIPPQTLSQPAPAGTSSLIVSDITAFKFGDEIIIDKGTESEERAIVVALIPAETMVILRPLTKSHEVDATIDFISDTGGPIVSCDDNNGGCDTNAACQLVTSGGETTAVQCTCNPGYNGNGFNCANVDECAAGTHNCNTNAVCQDQVGSFSCFCNVGWSGNGVSCVDINECLSADSNNCHADADCTNTPGGFTCACKDTFRGDGVTCEPGQLSFSTAPSFSGGSTLFAPTTGFQAGDFLFAGFGSPNQEVVFVTGLGGDGSSINLLTPIQNDQPLGSAIQYKGSDLEALRAGCNTNNGGCSPLSQCSFNEDTVSLDCTCDSGYEGTGAGSDGCTNVDECAVGATQACGSENSVCTDQAGSFSCSCASGYADMVNDGTLNCENINECASGNACPPLATCTDTPGSYTCQCPEGTMDDGQGGCTPTADINVCDSATATTVSTTNRAHSVSSSQMTSVGTTYLVYATGTTSGSVWGTGIYTHDSAIGKAAVHAGVLSVGEGAVIQVTVLPGQSSYSGTTANGVTTSSYGSWGRSYSLAPASASACSQENSACGVVDPLGALPRITCVCAPGYADLVNDGNLVCVDINECTSGAANCGTGLNCVNTPGSYSCQCPEGTMDDGQGGCTSTADINVCDSATATTVSTTNRAHSVSSSQMTSVGTTYLVYATGTTSGSVWGTGIYTHDSAIGKAAVHAGVLSVGEGAVIQVTVLPGQSSYSGTTANGVTTSSYGSWGRSYSLAPASASACSQENSACGVVDPLGALPRITCVCAPGYADLVNDGNLVCVDINECTSGAANCGEGFECNNTPGSYECVNTDPCTPNPCGVNTACAVVNDAASCSCLLGYTSSSGTELECLDVDECTLNLHNCPSTSTCVNTEGSFTCDCLPGYGNGVLCSDIDECTAGTHDCHANADCTNTAPGYTCACSEGYEGGGTTNDGCTPTNACTDGSHNCPADQLCTATVGGFTCACPTGYASSDFVYTGPLTNDYVILSTTQALIDALNGDSEVIIDVTEPATYQDEWYSVTGSGCNDGALLVGVNGFNDWSVGQQCKSTEFNLVARDPGQRHIFNIQRVGSDYVLRRDGVVVKTWTRALSQDFRYISEEIVIGAGQRNGRELWTGTIHSFRVIGGGGCADVNECQYGEGETPPCHANALCTNTDGSYTCQCSEGYRGDGINCEEIPLDICLPCEDNNCSEDAYCTNVDATQFTCTCNDGYVGDGVSCRLQDRLLKGQQLNQGERLLSEDGRHELVMQTDQNLVLYSTLNNVARATWHTNTVNNNVGAGPAVATLQFDSNFVVYSAGIATFATFTSEGDVLVLQNDGNLVLYNFGGSVIWESRTSGWPDRCLPISPCGTNAVCSNTPAGTSCACETGFTGDANTGCTAIPPETDSCGNSCQAFSTCDNGQCNCDPGFVLRNGGVCGRIEQLVQGQVLPSGQGLVSPNGRNRLEMQTDGNLVLYHVTNGNFVARWASNTAGQAGAYFTLQTDGNLVIYRPGGVPIWSNNRGDQAVITVQDDGNLVAYPGVNADLRRTGNAVWHTNTFLTYQCNPNPCGPDATCAESPNGPQCLCNEGFAGDGQICRPKYSCDSVCHADSTATAVTDGFVCVCNEGFFGNGLKCRPQERLNTHDVLRENEFLLSTDGRHRFVLQSDGNLVLYSTVGGSTQTRWASNTQNVGNAPYNLIQQVDGNLVLYSDGFTRATWSNNAYGAHTTVVQTDGNVVSYPPGPENSSTFLWESDTCCL